MEREERRLADAIGCRGRTAAAMHCRSTARRRAPRARTSRTICPIERSRFLRSFHHAFEGIIYATRTQPNMRVHFVIAALVLLATLILRLDRFYVVATIALIALVLSLELMNTAIESIVDLLTVAHHPLAKTAKDAAAGAVLDRGGRCGAVRLSDLLPGDHERRRSASSGRAGRAGQRGADRARGRRDRDRSSPRPGSAAARRYRGAPSRVTRRWRSRPPRMLAFFYQKPLAAILAYFVAFLVAQSRVEAGSTGRSRSSGAPCSGTLVALALYVLVRPHVVL